MVFCYFLVLVSTPYPLPTNLPFHSPVRSFVLRVFGRLSGGNQPTALTNPAFHTCLLQPAARAVRGQAHIAARRSQEQEPTKDPPASTPLARKAWILVMVDYFTKVAEFAILHHHSASAVASAAYDHWI